MRLGSTKVYVIYGLRATQLRIQRNIAAVATLCPRAGARAVDLGEPSVYQGGQSLKLSTKTTVFKRVILLINGAKHVDWRGQAPWSPIGAGPALSALTQRAQATNPRPPASIAMSLQTELTGRYATNLAKQKHVYQ